MEHSLQSIQTMEQRRFKDIIAFKFQSSDAPLAFHARNLEIAEISEQTWNEMQDEISPATRSAEAHGALRQWEEENSPDVLSGAVTSSVRALIINVTQICNLKCTYCAAGGDGTYGAAQTKINVEKTLPQIKFFLDRIPEGGSFRINFIGGEPLLYPDGIQEIVRYVKNETSGRNIQSIFSIVTNGTLINKKIIDLFVAAKMNVTVSLDGPAEINDIARPSKDGRSSTALTLEGLRQISEVKDQIGAVTVHGVFNRNNLDLIAAYRLYRGLNVDRYEFTYAVDENDQESNIDFVAQVNQIARMAYQNGGEAELRKISLFNQYFHSLDTQQRTENHCGAGKSFLMMDAKNDLYTCPWDVNNPKEKVGEGTTLSQKRLDTYSKPLVEKNNCQNCWARFLCGGGCMFVHKQATGSKHSKDGQFCYRTRSLISTAFYYYKLSRTQN